jgi:hypothetical protein
MLNFTQWINENSGYSADEMLADLEQLYDLGMLDAGERIREKLKLQASIGKLTKLSKSEITLLDSELAEEIEEWVTDSALDFLYEFDSPDEEEAFDTAVSELFNVELDWQVYLNGTIDVSMFYPDLGPEQRLAWIDQEGTSRSRDILDYYKEPIMRELNPTEVLGHIELSKHITRSIQELVSDLTNSDN